MSNANTNYRGRKSHRFRTRSTHAEDAALVAPSASDAVFAQMSRDRLVTAQELGAGSVQLGMVVDGTITAPKLAIGDSTSGNLIPDSGWEWYSLGDTTRWTFDASGFTIDTLSPTGAYAYRRGRYRVRLVAPVAATKNVTSDYIQVSSNSYWALTVMQAVESWTAGAAEVQILSYDSSKTLLQTVTLASFAEGVRYGAYSWLIAGSGLVDLPDGVHLQLPATTVFVRVRLHSAALSCGNWFVTAMSLVLGQVAALDGSPSNGGSGVSIDSGGVIIYDGKLVFKDTYGSTVLTGAGFGGPWEDFLSTGLYNGTWAQNDGTDATYWTVTQGTYTLSLVTSTEAPGGKVWRYAITGGASSTNTDLVADKVSVTGGQQYAVTFAANADTLNRNPTVQVRIAWYTSANSLISTSTQNFTTWSTGAGYVVMYGNAFAAPGNAYYAKVTFRFSNAAGGAGNMNLDIFWANFLRLPSVLNTDTRGTTVNLSGDVNVTLGVYADTVDATTSMYIGGRGVDTRSRQMVGGFELVDVPINKTDGAMALAGGTTSAYSARPTASWTGRIVGISWRISAVPGAGTITLKPALGGTSQGSGVVISSTSATNGYTALGPYNITAAGTSIGINISSSAALDAATYDVGAWLAIEWDDLS